MTTSNIYKVSSNQIVGVYTVNNYSVINKEYNKIEKKCI